MSLPFSWSHKMSEAINGQQSGYGSFKDTGIMENSLSVHMPSAVVVKYFQCTEKFASPREVNKCEMQNPCEI